MGPRLRVLVPPSSFFVRPGKGEQMFPTCVVPTVKDGGGGVTGLGALLVTLLVLFALGPSFKFPRTMNPPQHTSRLWKSYLTKKASAGVLCHMT